jgi:outer membrane murein-binding lipoprotein Lpp
MTNWMPRLAVLAIATSLLAGCAAARSDGGGCPTVPAYSRELLARAAGELQQLPPGAAIEQMLADYRVMREQARACTRSR